MALKNHSLTLRLFVAVLGLIGLISGAVAQDLGPELKAETEAAELRKLLTDTATQVDLPGNNAEALTTLRARIEEVRAEAFKSADRLTGPAADLEVRLKQLGPPPAEGTVEAPAITTERANLADAKAKFDAARKTLELLAVEAEQLSARAASLQRDRFFQRVFESSRSVLHPALWGDGVSAAILFGERFMALLLTWWGEALMRAGLLGIAAMAFFTAAVASGSVLTRGWLMRRFERWDFGDTKPPSNFDRLLRVAKRSLVNTGVALVAMLIVFTTLNASGILNDRFARVVRAILDSWLIIVALRAFVGGILAPNQPEWRLPQISDEMAARLSRYGSLAIVIFAIDVLMRQMFEVLFLPLQFSVVNSAIVAGALAFVLAGALNSARGAEVPKKPDARSRTHYFRWAGTLFQVLWILLFVVIVALLLGYIALAHFITTQIISTGTMVSAFYLIHHLADELILTGLRRNSATGRFLRQSMSLSESGVERLGVIFGTLVDLALVFVAVPAVFLQWAVTWVDLRSWITTAFFGFELGGVTLSPSLVVLAIGVLAAGIGLTKLFSSWLDRRVLARTEMDKGVRDSVRKGVGYSGYFLAAVVALTSAGVDFGSVTIIAGALGVGIGFGLQSIVNNFVSGLILLAERPVKVGDWIVLAPGEGFVKRINVRATEIETFDGASIIVPNSSLISEPVKNWTHADTRGKFVIPVSVARAEDPERVREVILAAVKSIPGISANPEPWVLLSRFGDAANELQLNFFVEDVVTGVFVASEARFAIHRAFQAEGIQIPIIQREMLRAHVPASRNRAKSAAKPKRKR